MLPLARSPTVVANLENALGRVELVTEELIPPAPDAIPRMPPTALEPPPKILAALVPSSAIPAISPSPGTAEASDATPLIIDRMLCQLVVTCVVGGTGTSFDPRIVAAAPVSASPTFELPPEI